MAIINTKKIVKGAKLIKAVLKKYRLGVFGMVVLGLLSGLFGGLGISVVIPLFSILVTKEELPNNFISDFIRDMLLVLNIPLNAYVLISLIIVLFALKALVQFWARYISEKTAAVYESDLRKKLFEKTMGTNWPNLSKYKGGYLERVLLFDTGQSASVISHVSGTTLLLGNFIVYALIALGISSIITLTTVGFGIILFFVFKPIFYKARKLIRNLAHDEKQVAHHVNEGIVGAKTIKSYAVENSVVGTSNVIFDQLKTTRIKVSLIRNLLGQFGEPTGIIFIGALFLLTYQSGNFNIASFAVAVYLIQKMFNSIQNAQSQLNTLNELVPYLEVTNKYYEKAIANKEISSGKKKFVFDKALEFRNIRFSYEKQGVLDGISFTIPKNSSIGLIGPSGVGKTTIADLIMGLLQPQGGDIFIDNVSVKEMDITDWRKNISYVSQDVFLLNDTIENNIKFYDNTLAHADIINAAKAANIYDTIMDMEEKFKTIVGERGIRLSAGQRQRISLARALVKNPSILILDEATSALDNESERAIQGTIKALKGKITMITIAHRLSTVLHVDELFLLNEGKIIEKGKPTELLEDNNSHFYRIYNMPHATDEK